MRATRSLTLRFAGWSAACAATVVVVAASMRLPAPAITVAVALLAGALAVAVTTIGAGHPHPRIGAANVVTLARLGLVALLAAVLFGGSERPATVIALGVVALALDGVDGHLARTQRLSSRFGAAFDMEVDSAFGLVLALLASTGPAGLAALALGVPRYLFGAAAALAPWLNGDLAPRTSRKVICVLQLIALLVLQLPGLPVWTALIIVAATTAALAWSFGVDILALRRAAS